MITDSKTSVEKEVERLFAGIRPGGGSSCRNPVTGGKFIWSLDHIALQKEEAARALAAREWFATTGPGDAPELPLSHEDIEDYRKAGGLKSLLGFYARSLSREAFGRQSYEVRNHPSFNDFACGLMAMAVSRGLWGLEEDQCLVRRFRARPLVGMTPGAYWASPKEYAETIGSYGPRGA